MSKSKRNLQVLDKLSNISKRKDFGELETSLWKRTASAVAVGSSLLAAFALANHFSEPGFRLRSSRRIVTKGVM